MKILVIYHKRCPDGIGGAWCFYHFSKKLGWPTNQIDYYAAAYYEDPPDLKEYTDVYIVDFSYSHDITIQMKNSIPGKLTVLDHHQSAITNLSSIKSDKKINLVLDDKRSGAQIAWDYFSRAVRPWFIDYIGDRDLWTFKLPHSKKINTALGIEYFDFQPTDNPIEKLNELVLKKADDFIVPGEYYLKMTKHLLNDICSKYEKREWKLDFSPGEKSIGSGQSQNLNVDSKVSYTIYVVESNVLISEVGDYLINNPPDGPADFVVIWRYSSYHKTFNYSIRCGDKGPDLSVIAKKFGGGGHACSSGFSTKEFFFN